MIKGSAKTSSSTKNSVFANPKAAGKLAGGKGGKTTAGKAMGKKTQSNPFVGGKKAKG